MTLLPLSCSSLFCPQPPITSPCKLKNPKQSNQMKQQQKCPVQWSAISSDHSNHISVTVPLPRFPAGLLASSFSLNLALSWNSLASLQGLLSTSLKYLHTCHLPNEAFPDIPIYNCIALLEHSPTYFPALFFSREQITFTVAADLLHLFIYMCLLTKM